MHRVQSCPKSFHGADSLAARGETPRYAETGEGGGGLKNARAGPSATGEHIGHRVTAERNAAPRDNAVRRDASPVEGGGDLHPRRRAQAASSAAGGFAAYRQSSEAIDSTAAPKNAHW